MKLAEMDNVLKNTIKHWKYISNAIHEPLDNNDYERLSKRFHISPSTFID